jgi:hypothetical protein
MTEFRMECFQNEFLPEGADLMHAVVTVTAFGPSVGGTVADAGGPRAQDRTELIIVDTSGSMLGAKLHEAKVATAAAIGSLPDGVRFGIISGNESARVVYPPAPPLAVSSAATRFDATESLRALEARGGTAIGAWISLATQVLSEEAGIRHAILLTDGRNEHETPEVLGQVLAQAEGVFQCDCRGVGTDWKVSELRTVATALLGSYDIVADPSGLTEDFTEMMQQSLSKQVPQVTLRIWTPHGAEVTLLKQLEPVMLDLTGARGGAGPLSGDYPTGSWGDESRDYHLTVRVVPGTVGDEMLAARITLLVGDEVAGQALVRAVWTGDVERSTHITRRVAEAMGESELAEVIQEGIDAHRSGDVDTATSRFGRAVRLAAEHGNDDALDRLATVVEIEDAATGLVRPRAVVDETDVMIVETRSTRTVRTRP